MLLTVTATLPLSPGTIVVGTKRAFAGAGQDDAARISRRKVQFLEQVHQVGRHLRVEGIGRLGTVQGDPEQVFGRMLQRQGGIAALAHGRWLFRLSFGTI